MNIQADKHTDTGIESWKQTALCTGIACAYVFCSKNESTTK